MKECIFCKKEFDDDDLTIQYCSDCGAPLRNKCSDYTCGKELDNSACFCKYCGSPSLFNNSGMLTPKKIFNSVFPSINSYYINDDDDELPFN